MNLLRLQGSLDVLSIEVANMKICHLTTSNSNCIPRLLRECHAAKAADIQTVIVLEGKNGSYFGSGIETEGIEFIEFSPVGGRFKRLFVRAKKMATAALETNADIIQIHDPEYLPYVSMFSKNNRKVIFDSHENYVLQIREKKYIPRFFRSLIAKFYGMYEAYVCKRIDCVLYPCTINGKNFFENRAKKSVKIENYSMPIPFTREKVVPKQVVYAGALTESRGLFNMAAATQLAGGTLVLCGAFGSKDEKQSLHNLGASSCVEYRGEMARSDLFQIYSHSAVGLSVLKPIGQYAMIDNLPTKICEYMQCGIPVIMSDFPYYKKKNEQYQFGICVDPENVTEISNAIRYLFDHPEEARRMGENGRRAIKEEFNWGVEEKKLIELYQNL